MINTKFVPRTRIHAPRAVLLSAVFAFLASASSAVPPYPFLEELWRPESGVVVATLDGEPISQEDVFLWQAIRGRDPLVARLATQPGTDSRALRPLEEAVRDLVQARLLAEDAEEAGLVELWYREKGARVLAAPVAVLVFADLLVRPEVVVQEEDILFAYRQGGERFREPAEVEIVRLRVPVAEGVDREAARTRAAELRTEARRAGGLRPLLEQHPEYVMDVPAGTTLRVARGSGSLSPEAEDEVFLLGPSQITPPLAAGDGVMLIEVVSRSGRRARPFASVREVIAARLARRFFRQQLDYRAARAVEEVRPVNRVKYFALLDDSMELLLAGRFTLTKGEFRTLFPDAGVDSEARPARALIEKTRFVIESEAIAQALDRQGLTAHARYERGVELARTLAAARKAREIPRRVPEPDDAQLRAYAEANRADLAPEWSSVLWRLSARPGAPGEPGMAERSRLARTMLEAADAVIAQSERLLGDRAALNGPTVFVSPQFVVERVMNSGQEDFTMTFERVGERAAREAREELGIDLGGLEVGRFSPPLPQGDGSVAAYYRADRVEKAPPPEAELLRRAREAWMRDAAENPARERLAALESQGRLRFHFPR